MWFKLGRRVCRFSIEEFALVTGLRCDGDFDLSRFLKKKVLFKKKIFGRFVGKVSKSELRNAFISKDLVDDEDVVKLGIVHILVNYLYGYTSDKLVDDFFFEMVDRDFSELANISFGKFVWDRSFQYLKTALKGGNKIFDGLFVDGKVGLHPYKLLGFPIAFLVWIYESIAELSPEFCQRVGKKFPRLLNWKSTDNAFYANLVGNVFNNQKLTILNVYPSSEERKKLAVKKFKFEPLYLPKVCAEDGDSSPGTQVDSEKLRLICESISSIKACQETIISDIAVMRSEFMGKLSDLSAMIAKFVAKNSEKVANSSDESAGFNEGEKPDDFDNVSSPISDDSKVTCLFLCFIVFFNHF
ncbi:uncharacterized protein LOC133802128 [Humulus lupulus]|uniref:uncharacterized protein LOC133802128 n=1 Tax=Humulus lupulus TaxID=3486 RepID=UPI002B41499E|nr:uncharacterized protein LOC133802128 [Humulus lupulus]